MVTLADAFASDDMKDAVDRVLGTEEPGPNDDADLRALPIDSLPIIAAIVETAKHPGEYSRAIELLMIKLRQFDSELPELEKARYCRIIVARCSVAPKRVLLANLETLRNLHRPEIVAFANTLLKNSDSDISAAAAHVLQAAESQKRAR